VLTLKKSANRSKGISERAGFIGLGDHRGPPEGRDLARALRNHNVWLVLTYVGLILLMARTYA
jgi:hypothetical protein